MYPAGGNVQPCKCIRHLFSFHSLSAISGNGTCLALAFIFRCSCMVFVCAIGNRLTVNDKDKHMSRGSVEDVVWIQMNAASSYMRGT